jgi:hypothetical protein
MGRYMLRAIESMKKLTIALIGIICLAWIFLSVSKSSGRMLAERIGIEPSESQISINNYYFSGIGMDHFYLWEIAMLDSSSMEMLVPKIGLNLGVIDKSGCLFLFKDQSPDWWDSHEQSSGTFRLFVQNEIKGGKICMYISKKKPIAYIVWFD